MALIHYGVKNIEKRGSPKMAKIQYGVKPDIFKCAVKMLPLFFLQFRVNVFAQNSVISVSCLFWVFRLVRSLQYSLHHLFSDTTFRLVHTANWNQKISCASSLWGGMSGYLANPTPGTAGVEVVSLDAGVCWMSQHHM